MWTVPANGIGALWNALFEGGKTEEKTLKNTQIYTFHQNILTASSKIPEYQPRNDAAVVSSLIQFGGQFYPVATTATGSPVPLSVHLESFCSRLSAAGRCLRRKRTPHSLAEEGSALGRKITNCVHLLMLPGIYNCGLRHHNLCIIAIAKCAADRVAGE